MQTQQYKAMQHSCLGHFSLNKNKKLFLNFPAKIVLTFHCENNFGNKIPFTPVLTKDPKHFDSWSPPLPLTCG